MKIKIKDKYIKAIMKILADYPDETASTPTEWINEVLDWYIRHIFTNGDNYIDR